MAFTAKSQSMNHSSEASVSGVDWLNILAWTSAVICPLELIRRRRLFEYKEKSCAKSHVTDKEEGGQSSGVKSDTSKS